MEYQKFINSIREQVQSTLGSQVTVSLMHMLKNNSTYLDALIIQKPELNITPNIYLNPYYHRYLNGMGWDDILKDILSTYHNMEPKENFDIGIYQDYSQVKNGLIMHLINYEANQELLKNLPHIRYLDLAIIFRYVISYEEKEFASVLVTLEHMRYWQVDENELYRAARISAPKFYIEHYSTIEEVMRQTSAPLLPQLSFAECPMLIVSNTHGMYGASVILYDHVLPEIAELLKDDCVIIPSSIHEVIILPGSMSDFAGDLDALIAYVNEYELRDDEMLSNHAYYYSRKTGAITM